MNAIVHFELILRFELKKQQNTVKVITLKAIQEYYNWVSAVSIFSCVHFSNTSILTYATVAFSEL
jgi:hypothetical protein